MKKKATGDRVIRIAAKLLQRWRERPLGLTKRHPVVLPWGDALALAGSCLSQDEAKGKRK